MLTKVLSVATHGWKDFLCLDRDDASRRHCHVPELKIGYVAARLAPSSPNGSRSVHGTLRFPGTSRHKQAQCTIYVVHSAEIAGDFQAYESGAGAGGGWATSNTPEFQAVSRIHQ